MIAGGPTPRGVYRLTESEWRALPALCRVEEGGRRFAWLAFVGEYAGDPHRGQRRLAEVEVVATPELPVAWMCERCATLLRLSDDVPPPNACFACGGELGRVEPSSPPPAAG
jgi:hypothetical protein